MFQKTPLEQRNKQVTNKAASERVAAQSSQRSDVTTYADITGAIGGFVLNGKFKLQCNKSDWTEKSTRCVRTYAHCVLSAWGISKKKKSR